MIADLDVNKIAEYKSISHIEMAYPTLTNDSVSLEHPPYAVALSVCVGAITDSIRFLECGCSNDHV